MDNGLKGTDNIQIIDDHIILSPLTYQPIECSLGYTYFTCMKTNKEKIAQYIADTDEEDTYASLLQRSIRTAIKLKTKNLQPDDLICLCTNNHKNSCVPFIAALFNNIKVCSLDPTLSLPDTTHLIRQVKPKLFFVSTNAVELIESTLSTLGLESEVVVFGESDTHQQFDDYLEACEGEDEFEPEEVPSVYDAAVVFFSSGTTGLPKGICLNHYGLVCQGWNAVYYGVITSVTLAYSSLYWISAVVFLTGSILSGTARVICSKFQPAAIWDLINKYQISYIFLAPSQAIEMCKSGRPDDISTTSLLVLLVGGASLPESQVLNLREVLPGTFVGHVYGQTEISGIFTLFNLTQVKDTLLLHHNPSSAGRPVPGLQYKVVDVETDQACGPNQRGELRVKSKFIMTGYYNLDSSESFDEDGWLKSGDIVYYDDDLCFFVVDRIKEMLKYRSWHVAPTVLEQVIAKHPAVKSSVVIGVPHEEDGDHPMALVVLNEGYSDVTSEDIERHVQERVDDRQRLRGGVKFLEVLPMTATGKVRRKYIKDMVLQGKF